MDKSFWHSKRVLVTGHTGFKGAWLCSWLCRMGANVTGYALPPPTTPNLFEVAQVKNKVESCFDDIRHGPALIEWMERHQPQIVFHLAAQPLVRRAYRDPEETYETNVMGTVRLFEAVRRLQSVRVVINVTSDKCYENRETAKGYRESDPVGGNDPYSSSKACAELITTAYRRSFFSRYSPAVAVATVRAGNVIGGGDWAEDRIIPDCMGALFGGKHLRLRNPSAVRPWQHVLDPLSGYLMFVERLWNGTPGLPTSLNFGPAQDGLRSVQQLVETLIRSWGEPVEWAQETDGIPEANTLVLDATLACSAIGWKPHLTFEEAVETTVAWYREYLAGTDMEQFTANQIEAYERVTSQKFKVAALTEP
jgi:CDP-glucose 4,6-dehydratase